MIEDLRNQAQDIYFARNSDEADPATRRKIESDLVRFEAKLAAAVSRGDLRKGIADALRRMAAG